MATDFDPLDDMLADGAVKKANPVGKFQPKAKFRPTKKVTSATSVSTSQAVETIESTQSELIEPSKQCSDVVPDNNEGLHASMENPIVEESNDVINLSSLDFTHSLPAEATSDCPLTEKPTKLATRRAKAASFPSPQREEASPSSRENETGRTLRPKKGKTNAYELIDEDVELSEECAAVDDENINNNELQVETESQTKQMNRKSRKPDDDNEKPGSKRKKGSSDQVAVAKPKKFSHSTRRTRVVDKALLAIPDEDLDYDTLPIRDLLARAEHIEKEMKKAAPVIKKSNVDLSSLNNEEDETFISKQGEEYNDEGGSPIAEDTTENFNYMTYMDKTPRTRWSKEDTEMFYNAVRQMGTDLAMIQQLFPGRTRRQLKLKYKKEERERPMRLHDALTNRTKDNSYFKMIIENLNQDQKLKQAEEKQNTGDDGSIDLTGNGEADEETTTMADDEEPKDDEHEQGEENEDVANDVTEAQSPLKSDDADDDDLFGWDQYTRSTTSSACSAARQTTPTANPRPAACALLELTAPYRITRKLRGTANTFVPDAQMLFHVLGLCDLLTLNTTQFIDSTPSWIPIVSQLYIAVLWHVMIIRVYADSGYDFQFKGLVDSLYQNIRIGDCMIPGPLVPFFQSIAAASGPFPWSGDVLPVMPCVYALWDNTNVMPRKNVARSLPFPCILLDQLYAFANAPISDEENSAYHTFLWYDNIFGIPVANQSRYLRMGPQLCGSMYTPQTQFDAAYTFWHDELKFFTRANPKNIGFSDYPQLLGLSTLHGPNQLNWFQFASETMAKYSLHFERSAPLKSISCRGLGASRIKGVPRSNKRTRAWLYPPERAIAPFLSSRFEPRREIPDALSVVFDHSDHELGKEAEQFAMVTHTNLVWSTAFKARDGYETIENTHVGTYWTDSPHRCSSEIQFKHLYNHVLVHHHHLLNAHYL
ncbi:hypothetical protein CASFOL_005166 [Castilleja foliolosa]|uniref:Myb-like domain-containing protein n=1 Tax=Castilleja foliolosa TaxID=1961234 RepID=A0ABD3E2P0_9LAMI